MNIGKRIQVRRKELNISVDELAKRLNKNRTTIYRYEKGDIENLPMDALKPLAEALKTSPAYLMGWEDELNDDAATVSDFVKLIRKQRNMSVEDFAKEIGISPDKLREYESRDKYIPISVINNIANYYRLTPTEGVGFENDVRYERFKVWVESFNHLDFTDEEHDKIIEYAKFLIYIREEK